MWKVNLKLLLTFAFCLFVFKETHFLIQDTTVHLLTLLGSTLGKVHPVWRKWATSASVRGPRQLPHRVQRNILFSFCLTCSLYDTVSVIQPLIFHQQLNKDFVQARGFPTMVTASTFSVTLRHGWTLRKSVAKNTGTWWAFTTWRTKVLSSHNLDTVCDTWRQFNPHQHLKRKHQLHRFCWQAIYAFFLFVFLPVHKCHK